MDRLIFDKKRTHRCGSLRAEDIGKEVVLMGWVGTRRDLGGCVFTDLRDREGITQVVFDPEYDVEAHKAAGDMRTEWVIGVVGKVQSRGENINRKIPTGEIEIAATRLEVFSKAKTTPFLIQDDIDSSEELRLRYRYLDLRRPALQNNFIMRHRFNQIVRSELDSDGFLELETPFLIKSTPEGARDYVVPSRVNQGNFYALPQSPQLFKQLFMVSGFDRYFQITRCFRDEDLRAERQPEFTQVDLEMSFCTPEDVQEVTERIMSRVFKELKGIELETPFERITYDDSMDRFGVDAPDLRYGFELKNISDLVANSSFKVFEQAIASGGVVKAINFGDAGTFSRKDIDGLTEFVKVYGAKGLAWIKVKEGGEWQGPIAKFFDEEGRKAITDKVEAEEGALVVFVADTLTVANAALGNLRKHIAKSRNLIPENSFRFCWVVDFPLFEWDEDEQRYFSAHHPFTAPAPEHLDRLQSEDKSGIKALAYDIVLNGVEIGGGSIRIHQSEIQSAVFEHWGLAKKKPKKNLVFCWMPSNLGHLLMGVWRLALTG